MIEVSRANGMRHVQCIDDWVERYLAGPSERLWCIIGLCAPVTLSEVEWCTT